MHDLQPLDQVLGLSAEPLRHRDALDKLAIGGLRVLVRYLFLAESVVMEFLGSLLTVYRGCEDIVEAKLPGKYVHHHPDRVLVHLALSLVWAHLGRGSLERQPVEGI